MTKALLDDLGTNASERERASISVPELMHWDRLDPRPNQYSTKLLENGGGVATPAIVPAEHQVLVLVGRSKEEPAFRLP